MITDAHAHIGHVKSKSYSADDLLRSMDSAGIDRSVVFSVVENIDNTAVLEAARRHPDRLIPFIVINPWLDGVEEQLRAGLDAGFCGLKLHPVRHGYPLDRRELTDPLLEVTSSSRVPVIAFGGQDYFSTPERFERLARRFPETDLIMAHMGFVNERDAAQRAAGSCPNLYVETSGVTTLRYITGAVDKAGASKVIFGSNVPVADHAEALMTVRAAVPAGLGQSDVLGGNLLRLLAKRV